MNELYLPLAQTKQVSSLIIDYVNEEKKTTAFYQYSNSLGGFEQKIKDLDFSNEKRQLLVEELTKQYKKNKIEKPTNIDLLLDENTYTVTTGHQLCLFGGPQYFIHKIVSVIKQCFLLKEEFPNKNFVPVFWLASEDHDFEEVNHTYLFRKVIQGNTNLKGAVGRMPMAIYEQAYQELYDLLGKDASTVKPIFGDKPQKGETITQATTRWVHRFFKPYNLVIIDGDSKVLKQNFSSIIKQELLNKGIYPPIKEQSQELKQLGYKTQVNPREINLFYLDNNLRERIVVENGTYKILNTNKTFDTAKILKELEQNPQRFSPNVVLRPIYQEFTLPNLAYIGGPGELAYWLQLKKAFEHVAVPFPVLTLRDMFVFVDKKTSALLSQYNLTIIDLFLPKDQLISLYLKHNSSENIDFSEEYKKLEDLKNTFLEKVNKIDATLTQTVEAEFSKTKKNLDRIKAKTIKQLKLKEETNINKLLNSKERLLPNDKLAERKYSFIPIYVKSPNTYLPQLITLSNPFFSAVKVF